MTDSTLQHRTVLVAATVVLAMLIGGVALAGTAAAAENLHDGSTTNPSTGETIYAANSTETKSITYGYVVENVTNNGDSVKLYLEYDDPINNTGGKTQRISPNGANVTCICDGSPQDVGISQSIEVVDGVDGDGNKETLKIVISPDKTDKPIDIIVNFTADVTWPKETTNVDYNVSGAVDEPNKNIEPAEKFEDVTVAGGLYTETAGPSSVGTSSATLSGHLWNLNGSSSADFYFTYWEEGKKDSTQQYTSLQNVSTTPDTYSESISGLDTDTTYVFKSAAETSKEFNDGPNLTFTTSGLTVDTKAAGSVSSDSATLNGDLTDLGDASSADVYFTYWEKGKKDTTQQYTSLQSKTSTGTFSKSVSGLSADTTYVFAAKADSSSSFDSGSQLEFTTAGLTVETNAASSVSNDTATLNGDLTDLGGASSADVYFTYWEKGNKGSTQKWTSSKTLSSAGTFSESVSGLSADTPYVFAAKADSSTNFDSGSQLEFTTAGLTVETNAASSVSNDTATLNGDLTDLGGASSADVYFTYWEKGNKGSTQKWTSTQTQSSTGTFSEQISGLDTGTTYVFASRADTGGDFDRGSEVEFTTDTLNVTTSDATSVDSSSATLNGDLQNLGGAPDADVYFTYWEKGNKDSTQQWTGLQTVSSTGSFSDTITGLDSGTTYVFAARASTGEEFDSGAKVEFTTS
jgi:subtilisin